MYYGLGAFFLVALLCVVVGAVAMKRRRDSDRDEGDDDFDFDKYEGFDQQ
jgi:hypothetical protein